MSTQTKKSVHFPCDEEIHSVHLIDTSIATDLLCYVSQEEFERCRERAVLEGCKARAQGLDKLLEGTFADPHPDVQKCLNEYVRHSDCRGLERSICETHFEERKSQRERAVKAVLIGQEMAKKQAMSAEEMSQQLRKVSLTYALDAKVFARRLGKADESACSAKKSSSSSKSSHKHASKLPMRTGLRPMQLSVGRTALRV
jgi:hypothetical protein